MKLVIGLGNPGRRYTGSRHNVGFAVVEELVRRHGAGKPRSQFQGEIWEVALGLEKVALLCPHTFMNLSGASVLAARDFYKLETHNLLVVCDDFNLALGRLRLRSKGTSGGQKGLADILQRLGTEEVSRLRLGIGPIPPNWEVTAFVLGRFAPAEQEIVDHSVPLAADAVAAWATAGIEAAMNKYNSAG